MAENERFGRFLRSLREERRLSLDAVEEMSVGLPERVTKSHLSRIENGRAVPTFPRMFTLSQIYGIPVTFLAERFEICLKRGMVPQEVFGKTEAEILDEARELRRRGRHPEALVLYETLIERRVETGDADPGTLVELRLQCINCLVKLSRPASAKEECEKLLGIRELDQRQRTLALQYFAMCCYRLGKFTVAMMAVEKSESEVARLEDPRVPRAHLAALKGNLHLVTARFAEAASAFESAHEQFTLLGDAFEACRAKLNLGETLVELGETERARTVLDEVRREAEEKEFDRQRAYALSHLALAAYREGNLDAAEAHCLRSNAIARPREYEPILFRNCFYLWQIARRRRDESAIKSNERTLRTYVSRVEVHIPEVQEFRSYLAGGK